MIRTPTKGGFAVLAITIALAIIAIATGIASSAPSPPFPLEQGEAGPRVADAQWLMKGHNAFEIRTYPAKRAVNGRYGPVTAAATRQMKHRLGYPSSRVNGRFGHDLRQLLVGAKPLPPLFAVRRAARHPHLELRWSYPVDRRGALSLIGLPGHGTHSFTAPPDNWQSDRAVDIKHRPYASILALASGQICPKLPFGWISHDASSRFGGARLYLCTSDGEVYYYAHLAGFAAGIRPGARVHAGRQLATGGQAAGVWHLHLACQRCDIVAAIRAKALG